MKLINSDNTKLFILKDSDHSSDDLSSGVFSSSNSHTDGHLEWLASANQPSSFCSEGATAGMYHYSPASTKRYGSVQFCMVHFGGVRFQWPSNKDGEFGTVWFAAQGHHCQLLTMEAQKNVNHTAGGA